MLSSSLTLFFGRNSRAGRSRRAECQPAELQSRRRRLRALADQIQREFAIVRLGIVVEHLEPVDDGADRADQIVAHPRAQQRRQFEHIGRRAWRRRAGHQICSWKAFKDTANHACSSA
jgi:hypothetical protein